MEQTLIEQMGLKDEYKLFTQVGRKLVYAHTVYYEMDEPDYEQFITEDDTPVDNLFSELEQRLLIDPLQIEKWTTRDFWASSNVGIYYAMDKPCIVPDMFLSFDVQRPDDLLEQKNKCYFIWTVGKPPELVVEIVSNKIGKEDDLKMKIYASMGVTYYILVDPYLKLDKKERLKVYVLREGRYELLTSQPIFMEEINLGVMLWHGIFEGKQSHWARWCSKDGHLLSTGVETKAVLSHKIEEQEVLLVEKDTLLVEKDTLLVEKDILLVEKDTLLVEKDTLLVEKDTLLVEKQKMFEEQKTLVEVEKQRVEKLIAQLKAMGLTPIE